MTIKCTRCQGGGEGSPGKNCSRCNGKGYLILCPKCECRIDGDGCGCNPEDA
jgi:RecJ-like exonuclease